MEQYELEVLSNSNEVATVTAVDNTVKTLLYGYTTERDTHHVYQKNGVLHFVVYNGKHKLVDHRYGRELSIDGIVPNKRLYPESCDFDFCLRLKRLGVDLPFSTYGQVRAMQLAGTHLHGLTIDELEPVYAASLAV